MQYEIKGTPFPAVICHLQDGEQMITEGGGMSWMTPNMVMEPQQTEASEKLSAGSFQATKCSKTGTPAVAEKV